MVVSLIGCLDSEIESGLLNLKNTKRLGRYFLLQKMVQRGKKVMLLTIPFCLKANMTGSIAAALIR